MGRKRKREPRNKKHKLKAEEKKEDLVRAVHLIKNKDVKVNLLDKLFSRKKKIKAINLCSYDSAIPNLRRQNLDVLPTNTQLLLSQLRKCISEHNWPAVARCVYYMLDMNGKLMPIVWKAVILILLNHHQISTQNLNEFLQMCLGIRTLQEKYDFLLKLLTLPADISVHAKSRIKEEESEDEQLALMMY